MTVQFFVSEIITCFKLLSTFSCSSTHLDSVVDIENTKVTSRFINNNLLISKYRFAFPYTLDPVGFTYIFNSSD